MQKLNRVPPLLPPLSAAFDSLVASVNDLSSTGLSGTLSGSTFPPLRGTRLPQVRVSNDKESFDLGPARVVQVDSEGKDSGIFRVGLAFEKEQPELVGQLGLRESEPPPRRSLPVPAGPEPTSQTLDQFADAESYDVLEKCRVFTSWIDGMHEHELYQRFYRLPVEGSIDRQVTVKDYRGGSRTLTCFDSNSYLGLHLHPKVVDEVIRVTAQVGFGTPSAQLLCGTNKYLLALEEDLAEFLSREAAMVFPTGFAANIGILRALLRSGDAVFRDQHAHASIHEGCRKSGAEWNKIFAHNDVSYLRRLLRRADRNGAKGKLVVTDGVFSMHGELAPLPELASVCRQYGARLMVDDAHGVGVMGPTGRGIEEHFDCVGAADILMGTLSKALGALGGYVVGDKETIDYLRWFAPSGVFTTTLPAPICAGLSKALEVIRTEPEHQQALWDNIRRFVPPLQEAGFKVSGMQSPIVTLFVGEQETLWKISRDLYDAGIKAGNVIYPAVPRDGCILRFTLNARHTPEDIDSTVQTLLTVGHRYGLID